MDINKIDEQIEKLLKMLEAFSTDDRDLAQQTYVRLLAILENAQANAEKIPQDVIPGMSAALKLKIESTERLNAITTQLMKMRERANPLLQPTNLPKNDANFKNLITGIRQRVQNG